MWRLAATCPAGQARLTGGSMVMNYNDKFSPTLGEPDCSPHPFDIMAIFALYQTVPDPP